MPSIARRAASWFILILCSASPVFLAAQQATVPTITFKYDFPGSDPEHFAATVRSNCVSDYESNGKISVDSDAGEAFHLQFAMTKPTCDRIFDLTKKARYFSGELESKRGKMAFIGTKTLGYKDGQHSTQAAYNYSSLAPVQELTTIFQNLSTTLEFGRRLQYDHRYQKLALDEELKRMEASEKDHDLAELQAVAPILNTIAEDKSVMNVVRARALRLLSQVSASTAAR